MQDTEAITHDVKLFVMPDKTAIIIVCSLIQDGVYFLKHEGCSCGMLYLPNDAIPECFDSQLYGHYETFGQLIESCHYYKFDAEQRWSIAGFLKQYKHRQALGHSLS